MKTGCKFGTHRVIEPKGVLPQAADVVSNDMNIFDNEILIDVEALNIDSASFHQLKEAAGGDEEKLKASICEIVRQKGKMKNPVTGSGGVLIGKIAKIGPKLEGKIPVKVGDKIVTLVSLSQTPLRIDSIDRVHMKIDRVDIKGQAILFETGIYAKIPTDIPEAAAMAALDVAGAPAQAAKLVRPGQKVLILGGTGKSGILCAYEARKRVGPTGLVVGVGQSEKNIQRLKDLGFCHHVIKANAQDPIDVLTKAMEASGGAEYDITINCLNVPNAEMSCILPVRDGGIVYFFSMATSFTKAALGAEGVGKDVDMIIGNGYTKDHAEITLQLLRECPALMKLFCESYTA
ncbi:MAG TPA: L-erythro-3,5-diaminohexanoate dehydrogenase [Candidatus Ozemobacteraceae bacterium]|nr:L-erythro-3,5-diaminohexanoate dehydrogenase [Candidatus Ozemobacteraceae bacterium]HQG27829.1 L-erythro-3,5-diaminohexanoate dehydrogenase [Candidatus Ozemobacteraceae bacterium]